VSLMSTLFMLLPQGPLLHSIRFNFDVYVFICTELFTSSVVPFYVLNFVLVWIKFKCYCMFECDIYRLTFE
jgi:hypothetical protein